MRVPIKRQVIQVISFCAALITVFAFTAPAVGGRCEFPSGCIQVCATVADWCPPVIGGTDPCDYPPPPTPLPPPDPPAEDDRTFVVEGESVECCADPIDPMFKATKSYSLKVRRIVGYTDRRGYLENPEDLIAKGVVGRFARLSIMAWDVDPGNECFPREVDAVYFNGPESVGSLKGSHNEWHLNTFYIPIEKVKFAVRERDKPLGSEPTAFRNKVRIRVDVGQSCWCTTIGWVALEIQAMSPVVLIHGWHGAYSNFWTKNKNADVTFVDGLDEKLILWDDSINNDTYRVGEAGEGINRQLPAILRAFGVDSCHLVGHSKGGLDQLEYLVNFNRGSKTQILSITSLGSPLQGSVLADTLEARRRALPFIVRFRGFPYPFLTRVLGLIAAFTAEASDLTTTFAGQKADQWMPTLETLPPSVRFITAGSDLDADGDGEVDWKWYNDEAKTARVFSGLFVNQPWLFKILIADVLYQILLKVKGVTTRWAFCGGRPCIEIRALPTQADQKNDILVTMESARGNAAYRELVDDHFKEYVGGANAKTHADIADEDVAKDIVPWLIEQEWLYGDMRPFD